MRLDKSLFLNYLAISCTLLIAGCSTPKIEVIEAIFYPPAPAQPRLQYLTSYSLPANFTPPRSAFKTFLLGEQNDKSPGIAKPYGIEVNGSELYVCDTMTANIHVLNFAERTWEYFSPKFSSSLKKPINIAIDTNGVRYVADPIRGDVPIYNATGKFIDAINLPENMKPVGVAVSDDRIAIADLNNHTVHLLDKETRALLFSIPQNPENKQEQLFSPTNVTFDQQGNIFISDTGSCRVQKYAPDGTYLQSIGSMGTSPGQFVRNKGLAVDRNNFLYVVDAATQLVQIFNEEGLLLLAFGQPGASPYPLSLPADVVIDYENISLFQPYASNDFELEYLIFVSSQYGPRKISVYGFGHSKK